MIANGNKAIGSGEGIYFAAKSGRMAGEAVSAHVSKTGRLPTQAEMTAAYIKPYDAAYGPTYTVLDILQRVFYTSNSAREAFVEMCKSEYVQRQVNGLCILVLQIILYLVWGINLTNNL